MFFTSLLIALAIAFLITAIFSAGFGYRGPWDAYWPFFLIVFFFAWIAGLWWVPYGPALWGVSWLPMLFVALVIGLLIAAATPSRPPRTRTEAAQQLEAEATAAGAVSIMFWVLIGFLVVAVIVSLIV